MIKTEKTDIDVDLVLGQREYLSIGQGHLLHHGQDHDPKGWLWKSISLFFFYIVKLYIYLKFMG